MDWGKRLLRRVYVSVSGFLLALTLLQSAGSIFDSSLFNMFPQVAEAATGIIDPDGNGTTGGTATTCTSSLHWECINDDGVRSPTAPSTAGDYIQLGNTNQNYSTLGTITNVSQVTSITVSVYHAELNANMATYVSLWDAAQTTQYGTEVQLTNRNGAANAAWDTATFGSLTLSQANLDGLRLRLRCARPGGGATNSCREYAAYATVTYTPVINVTVSSAGSQQDLVLGTTTAYFGGTFRIVENTSSRSITSITVTENGTIDAASHLKNIQLRYDLDNVAPYDCASVSYNASDTQFGSTDADGFSAANGTSVFSGSATISTTQAMCVYVVGDVQNGATTGQTVELEISDPSTQVVGSGSAVVSPGTAITLSGTTNITQATLTQTGYHWRNDDGNETGATSATGGTENTALSSMSKGTPYRLRLSVSNEGTATSPSTQYRIEYASKVSTCSAATGWTDVGAVGGDFDMVDSTHITEGGNTTNIVEASGGITNANTTFLTTNGGLRDTTSQTGGITLTSSEYVDLEYSLQADNGLSAGAAYCFRVTSAGTALPVYDRYAEATIAADVLVTSTGVATSTLLIPSTNNYAGGVFRIAGVSGGSKTITGITIEASGTSNVNTDVENIELRYDLDNVAPYDCASVSYSGSDTQFGSTIGNFTGGEAAFTGSMSISPTSVGCVYIEYDVDSAAENGETISFRIPDASTDVVSTASVAPIAQVTLSGSTVLAKAIMQQNGYHWRNNDGSESAATSATGGNQNTVVPDLAKDTTYRIRIGVSNEGLATSSAITYRLEWAQKISTCSAASSWARMDTALDVWQMSPTGNLTDGGNTTNITDTNLGAVSDQNPSFKSANGGVKDDNDTTVGVTLSGTQFLELEYSVRATDDASQGATYCFRVTNAGTPLDTYVNYPEATIKLDNDFRVQRGVSTMTGNTLTITAGTDYEAPVSASNAFIRITNTQLTGAGPNTGGGNNNASDVTAYITNPSNITTSVTFQRGPFAAGNTILYWEIVEYQGAPGGENEFIVRRQEPLSYAAGNTTITGTAVSGVVDDTDMAIFITGQHNEDAGRNAYNIGLSVASWNAGTDQVTLTRGGSGSINNTSYAAIEFTGANWKVQRIAHTYTAAGSTETETMTSVNSLSRTFVHAQKTTTQTNHADFGHTVWLSGVGQVSFLLDSAAGTPGGHTSVAWVIENTQTIGETMVVSRSNGSLPSSGTSPQSNNINIGATLGDISIASLFVTNFGDTTSRSWPEPIMGATISNTTQYLLWRSDAASNVQYRTEVVQWPTAARKLEQNYYRLYVDNNALTPSDPWPAGGTDIGENTELTVNDEPLGYGQNIRLRMTVSILAAVQSASLDAYMLQYGERVSTCGAISQWRPLGDSSSSTALWRGVANTPADGTALSTEPPVGGDLLISIATVAGTYEEANNSALNPYLALPGDEVEYDWAIEHNGAKDKTSYCFRMVEADGTNFRAYNQYPTIRTAGYGPVSVDWKWFGDETNVTPTSALAATNTAPIDIANQDIIKLRTVVAETGGATGNNVKFKVQFSEYPDFSSNVRDVVSTTTCVENSLWCYADGAGVDNAIINNNTLGTADSCNAGVGAGCGTHNESTSTTTATFDHTLFTDAEFEFTLRQAGARANAVYYFRLYDVESNQVVVASTTYPSLVIEGAALVFDVEGLTDGTVTEGETLDVASTPGLISYGPVPFNEDYTAGYRLSVGTNATQGFQIFMYADGQLRNQYGEEIPPVTGTNASPTGWNTGCTGTQTGCFGYHAGDDLLEGGSARFGANDSYAAITTTPQEVMYSSMPLDDTHDIVYKMRIGEEQPAGEYETTINFLAMPIF